MTDDRHETSEHSEGSTDSDELEEEVYTLVFQKCDAEGVGAVNIDHVVDYIGKQFNEDHEHENVRYNLDLLREMLHCSTRNTSVDQSTYTHVIRKWVRNVRSRSSSALSLSEEPSHEDDSSTMDLSMPDLGAGDVSKESLEASGGASSHSAEFDQRERVMSLQLDNKRLQDANHNLHHQIEQSEESLNKLVSENNELKQRMKNLQQSLGRLQALEQENQQLSSDVISEREKCLKLNHSVDRQDQELHQLTEQMSRMQSQLFTMQKDSTSAEEEKQAMKRLLHQKEELIEKLTVRQKELETAHVELAAEMDVLTKRNDDLTNMNETLRSENSELQGKLLEPERHRSYPVSSTPFRPSVTFHDELLECSLNANSTSFCPTQTSQPSSTDSMEVADQSIDEFSKVMAETRAHIRENTDLLDKGLSELISKDPPPVGTNFSLEGREEFFERVESKVSELAKSKRQTERKAKKLSSDLKKLRSENQKLKDQLRQRAQNHLRDAGVQGTEEIDCDGGSGGQVVERSERILVEAHAHDSKLREGITPGDRKGSEQGTEEVDGDGQVVAGTQQSHCTSCRQWLWMLFVVLFHLLKGILLIVAILDVATLLVILTAQLHSNHTSSLSPFEVLFSMFGSNLQLTRHGPVRM